MKKEFENKKGINIGLIIKTIIINLFVTAAFVFLFAIIMYLVQAGYEYSTVLATVALAAGTFSSAYYAAKKVKSRGFIIGGGIGLAVFMIITLLSFIIDKDEITANTLFHFVIILLSGFIGGIMGVNKANNKKYI